MSEYCIELNNVTKKFGKFTAVDSVNIKLDSLELLLLLSLVCCRLCVCVCMCGYFSVTEFVLPEILIQKISQ